MLPPTPITIGSCIAVTGARSPDAQRADASISTSTTSPISRLPTPDGVPVEITSPTSSVMCELTNAINVGTSKIRSEVDESWRTWPLTRVTIRSAEDRGPRRSGAERAERVEPLGPGPLGVFLLQIADGDVVDAGEPEHEVERALARDPAGASPDHHPSSPS